MSALNLAAVRAALPGWHVSHNPVTDCWRAHDPGYQLNGIVVEAVDPDGAEVLARVRALVIVLAHADGRGGRIAPDTRLTADRRVLDPTEIAPSEPSQSREVARFQGFTGDSCPECGSLQMVRNGTCQKCTNCGTTTGCS